MTINSIVPRICRMHERQPFGLQPIFAIVPILPSPALIELIGQFLNAYPQLLGYRHADGWLGSSVADRPWAGSRLLDRFGWAAFLRAVCR